MYNCYNLVIYNFLIQTVQMKSPVIDQSNLVFLVLIAKYSYFVHGNKNIPDEISQRQNIPSQNLTKNT